ncbi:SDR family NAD(P)-dependent oxidoreductase [Nocardia asiatica]|uniref:SDR family NAD(P)-dependent oxidoreductase n=1 Tax=Nocardia asiatica TaxID=209252 RepID=UPI003EDFF814
MTRTVVVTGGSRGIGRHVVQRFAAAGDFVVFTGRDHDQVERTADELGATGIRCDSADPADVQRLAGQLGPTVDVLVNMAGANTDLGRPTAESLDQIAAQWRANLDANLLSAVLTTTALRDRLPKGGAVVNIGSIGAEYAASSYGAAKAALAAWSAGLSAQLAPHGVTVNVVSPGYIAETDFFRGELTDERRAALIAATHNKKAGLPEDVAGLVEFLASPAARHITGQTLHINGGAHTTR